MEYPEGGNFSEFFSGPNAPLSAAVHLEAANVAAWPVPQWKPCPRIAMGPRPQELAVPLEPMAVEELMTCMSAKPLFNVEMAGKKTADHTLPGKQRRWSMAGQLVAEEVGDPMLHLAAARAVKHPMVSEMEDDPDTAHIAHFIYEKGADTVQWRWNQIEKLREVKRKLQGRNEELRKAAGPAFKRMNSPLDLALMEWILEDIGCEDRHLAKALAHGLPLAGPAATSPLFEMGHFPVALTLQDLLLTAPARRKELEAKVKAAAARSSTEAVVIWTKTMKEVELCQASGPLSAADVEDLVSRVWNPCRRLALNQGLKENGVVKWRVIDDHCESRVNAAAERKQCIQMHDVATIARMAIYIDGKTWQAPQGRRGGRVPGVRRPQVRVQTGGRV